MYNLRGETSQIASKLEYSLSNILVEYYVLIIEHHVEEIKNREGSL